MGGKIFSEARGDLPALQTPRMTEAVYTHIKDLCTKQLQPFFAGVVVPAEAPDKTDYGDVDFLVETPVEGFTWEAVEQSLNAHRTVKSGESRSFAVPITFSEDTDADIDIDVYAQIDVNLCRPGFLQWERLLDSHGDMWQIIGRFLRPLGLTATGKGLHVRISEIEALNRVESMLYLTHDVGRTLEFLGLDVQRYQAGFTTRDDLYRWCISGRFFHPTSLKRDLQTSNDRQRMRKRPMFRDFNDEWMPLNDHLWPDKEPVPREEVLVQALAWFGREEEYELKVAAWRLEQAEGDLWAEIMGIILEGPSKNVNIVLRGLRRWVGFDFTTDADGTRTRRPVLRAEAEMDADRQPRWVSQLSSKDDDVQAFTKDTLLEWVRENWRKVKSLEKGRVEAAKAARRLVIHS